MIDFYHHTNLKEGVAMPQIKFNKDAGIGYTDWAHAMWEKGFQLSSHDLAEKLNVSPPTVLSYFRSLNYVVYNPENRLKKMAYFKKSDINDYCNAHTTFTAQTRNVFIDTVALKIATDAYNTQIGYTGRSIKGIALAWRSWANSLWSITGINENICWFSTPVRYNFCARNRGKFPRVTLNAERYKDFFLRGVLERGEHETAHPEIIRRRWFIESAIRAEIKSPGKTKSLIIHFTDWNISEEDSIIVPAIYSDEELKQSKIKDKCNGMMVPLGCAAFGKFDVE